MPLYIFAGHPETLLHAGGMREFVNRENIGILQEGNTVQYRKEGRFIVNPDNGMGELAGCYKAFLSPNLPFDWNWFPENWSFGNGVTCHKTRVHYKKELAVIERDDGGISLESIVVDRTAYAARWPEGQCPDYNHEIHLTWLVFEHELPRHAVEHLWVAIEHPDYVLDNRDLYTPEHFYTPRELTFPKPKITVG